MSIGLHPDWWRILTRAWSVRLIALAFILTMLEVALPLVQPYLSISPVLVGALAGISAAAAFIARLVAQKKFEKPANGA